MKPKPDIEQFVGTLKRETTDYLTIAELGIHPKIKEQLLGRPLKTLKDEVDFWYRAGYDYVKLQPIVDFNPDKVGMSLEQSISDSGVQVYNWATEGQGIISSYEDLEKFRFPKKSDFDYSRFEKISALLPEGMGVVGQYGDIFTLTWEMMGFEGFSMTLFENPELIKALNERIGELVISMFEYFAQNDNVDALWMSDDIAYSNALLMSPDVLRQFFFPWLKKIGDLARDAGKPLIYHSDGVLWDVFDDIISCGVNAIHPIEPKAMTLSDVKNSVGDKLCLIGHVDVDLLARGSCKEIRDQVNKNIEIAGQDGGYIIGSGNSIPDYVPFENYMALLQAAKEFSH